MVADFVEHRSEFIYFLESAKKKFDAKWNADFRKQGNLSDYNLIKTLSSGSFGRVLLAQSIRHLDKVIALKMMDKHHIVKTKQVEHTHTEIRVLDAVAFPFLIYMECYFQDNCYLFLGMPYINGGELFYHLRKVKRFNETMVKFYAAQVILALEYIHYMGLVYRDLKPENILVDKDGYLRIVDYGFCKKINEGRTYTLCGTPEYLAPEVILCQGYNKSADWWSIGILIFELTSGITPFFSKDQVLLYENILSGKFEYTSHFSESSKTLLSNMIVVDRSKRYGILKNGSKDVKDHVYFRGTKWSEILEKKIRPSYIPDVTHNNDSRCFERMAELPMKKCKTDEHAFLFSEICVEK